MWPVSERFLQACRDTHRIATRVELWRDGVRLWDDVPVVDGRVTVDGNSRVRRTVEAQLALREDQIPSSMTDPLIPSGSVLKVYRGIQFQQDDVELAPLGVFRIDSLTITRPNVSVTVRGSDYGINIGDDEFVQPQPSAKATVKAEIAYLVQQAHPTVTIVDRTTTDADVAPAVWEGSRWDAIDRLADAIGATCFYAQDGSFVIAPVPASTDPEVYRIAAGESGVLISSNTEISRLSTYNAVVVTGAALGDALPPVAVVRDMDPDSPTYWDGPFGHRPKRIQSQQVTTQEQADQMAAEELAKAKGLPRSLNLTAVPNPALDAGDVVGVGFADGVTEKHVIKTLSVGLGVGSAMSATTATAPGKVL